MNKKIKSLTMCVLFPNSELLPYLLTKTYSILPYVTRNYEIVIVDNAANKELVKLVITLQKYLPRLKIMELKNNVSYGQMIRNIFQHSKKDWIMLMDGNGSYWSEDIEKMVKAVRVKSDFINGNRVFDKKFRLKKIIRFIYNKALHAMYDIPLSDPDCNFRLIRKKLLKLIKLHADNGSIYYELISLANKKKVVFSETAVKYKSLYSLKEDYNFKRMSQKFKEQQLYFRK